MIQYGNILNFVCPWIGLGLMVCFHCLTLIPTPIPMKLGSMIMCRTVSTEPRPIPIPIPIPMATVPNLAPISVLIRWNLSNFHCNFYIGIGRSEVFVHFIGIGIGIGVRQWKRTISPMKNPEWVTDKVNGLSNRGDAILRYVADIVDAGVCRMQQRVRMRRVRDATRGGAQVWAARGKVQVQGQRRGTAFR